jgi:hypothetical protein
VSGELCVFNLGFWFQVEPCEKEEEEEEEEGNVNDQQ